MSTAIANREIFIAIPAYNEGRVLGETVSQLVPYGFNIVVVDDGSACSASSQLGAYPVYFLRHMSNLGQGAALQTATEFALSQGAKIVVHFDADGQHSAALIERLIEPILQGDCDVVLGSRFLDPDDRKQVPWKKRILLKLGVFVSWLFTGVWLTDTHNGFRALSRTAAEKIRLTENGFAHATELLEEVRIEHLRFREVPTTIRYTEYSMAKGQSMLNSVNIVLDLLIRKVLR